MNATLLFTALFNGAWQGAVLCTLAYFVFRMVRRLNATTMFAVWSVLLGICVVLPFANYAFAPKTYTIHVSTPAVREPVSRVKTAAVSMPRVERETYVAPAAQRIEAAPQRASFPNLPALAVSSARAVLQYAVPVLWILALIAFVRVAVLLRDIVHMFAARGRVKAIDPPVRLSQPLNRPFRFVSSTEFASPCVLGFSPAMIVIPEGLLEGSRDELLSVVLHESEHVRRFDDVQNVIQRFIGAVAFFLPGVRIAIRELALYREQICDDAAVNGTGDAVSYAMTLTGMAQWATGRGAPVPSLIFKRKQLVHRLEVLLDSAVNHSLHTNRRFAFSAAAAIALAAAIVLRVQMPVIAESIEQPKPPHVPKAAPAAPKAMQAAPKFALVAPAVALASPKKPAAAPKPAPKVVPKAPAHAPAAPKPGVASASATPCPPSYGMPAVPRVHGEAMVRAEAAVARARALAPLAPVAYARIAANAARVTAIAPMVPAAGFARIAAVAPRANTSGSSDLLDSLDAAGIHNLSVDQLIAIRDHGVSPRLVRAAMDYFGPHFTTKDLTDLADHGVSTEYLETLRANGVTGIPPSSVWMLMDHGVSASLVRSANAYFRPAPSAADLAYLADHGVSVQCIDQLRSAGVTGVSIANVVRLADHGVPASYIIKVRRMNPSASIDDVIRLHDAGI